MVNTTTVDPCKTGMNFNSTPSGPMVKRQQNEISTSPIRVEGQAISASSCPIKPKIIGLDFSEPGERLLRGADVACKGRAPVFPWNTKPLELWMRADEHGIGQMGFQPGKRQWGERSFPEAVRVGSMWRFRSSNVARGWQGGVPGEETAGASDFQPFGTDLLVFTEFVRRSFEHRLPMAHHQRPVGDFEGDSRVMKGLQTDVNCPDLRGFLSQHCGIRGFKSRPGGIGGSIWKMSVGNCRLTRYRQRQAGGGGDV